MDTRERMRAEVILIAKRGRPLSDREFCSLECVEGMLGEVESEWTAFGVHYSDDHTGRTVHSVMISEKTKHEAHKYRDITE